MNDNRLRELRISRHLTQEEVALIINVDSTYVSKLENGERPLTDELAIKFAKLFKCQTHQLYFELERTGMGGS